jgi:hypothetical protein
LALLSGSNSKWRAARKPIWKRHDVWRDISLSSLELQSQSRRSSVFLHIPHFEELFSGMLRLVALVIPSLHLVFLRSVRRLLVRASVVPSAPILVTLI